MRLDAKSGGVLSWLWIGLALAAAGGAKGADRGTLSLAYVEARALFEKTWEPTPGEGHGDGLGPLYNATSCVACHHQGGPGGAGKNEHNVTLLSLVAGVPATRLGDGVFVGEPEDLHPGLRNSTTVVLHDHATSDDDRKRLVFINRLVSIQTRDDLLAIRKSRRSTPAHDILLKAEARKYPGFPEISGRVSRLKGGQLGRFGWKGQTATLEHFVIAACSNELGLEVPGRHQVSLASAKDFNGSKIKLDMDERQTQRLVDFVQTLPRPTLHLIDPIAPLRGRVAFEAIGCAACHTPKLGSVDGLYTDLLLHDLGDRIMDFGSGYGGPAHSSGFINLAKTEAGDRPTPTGEAAPTEWRTPPLWGVASSPPYLHDGRAGTLDQAIRLHGGEATATAKRYTQLSFADNQALLSMLHSLVAPPQALRLVDAAGRTEVTDGRHPLVFGISGTPRTPPPMIKLAL